ncbi:MAG: class I SAM-dependent methyltransferase [Gemmatimonadaceae bacterium]
MRSELLALLRCPGSLEELRIKDAEFEGEEIRSGWLVSKSGEKRYPITNFVPRFVAPSNYADSFGLQWNRFRKTQLDSYSGVPVSADRFWKATGWKPEWLEGAWILDAGCGAGRFAEIALAAGANVVAIDYSAAVDACYANLRSFKSLHVLQADIYSLPLSHHSFDFVYSLGVLQHTPNVEAAFAALPPTLKSGGRLAVDFYAKSWKSALLPKYWLRPFTKRIPKPRLFSTLASIVPAALRVSRFVGNAPLIGNSLSRLVPVANYYGILPLNEDQHREWALLDTFDWFSPTFDNPQTPETVTHWLEEAGLSQIEVLRAGHLVGRGLMPDAARN